MIRRGKANGGPRHNVVLTAGQQWSGVMRGHADGHYVWSSDDNSWMWTLYPVIAARAVNEFINTDNIKAHKSRSR